MNTKLILNFQNIKIVGHLTCSLYRSKLSSRKKKGNEVYLVINRLCLAMVKLESEFKVLKWQDFSFFMNKKLILNI